MKKYFFFILFFSFVFLSACNDSSLDEQPIDEQPTLESLAEEIKESIIFPKTTAENLHLPTTLTLTKATVSLKWQSSNEDAISLNGTIHPGLVAKQTNLKVR